MSAPDATKQPRGLYLLFGVEMWERFSFYGMKAMLFLFLTDAATGGWGWAEEQAGPLYGAYTGLVYVTALGGGFVADRWLGTHRSMLWGGSIIAAGHFTCALPFRSTFLLGLLLIVLGTGLFKPNVSTMVGQLYKEGDGRRDAGFTLFYMGINVGALLGPIVCGLLHERIGWHVAFAAAGVGMVLGLLTYVKGRARFLAGIGDFVPAALRDAADAAAVAAGHAVPPDDADKKAVRDRVIALLLVCLFTIPFWVAYEQTGSSMNLFAQKSTDRVVGGFTIPTEWFQSINPAVLLLCAPILASLWVRLAARGREPSTPAKMALGLVLLGGGFLFMVAGASRSSGGALVSPLWLVGAYSFHTWGELCLSPIGLSLVTRLAPARRASLMMGIWFLSTGLAEFVAGLLAGQAARVERGEVFTLLGGRADFFLVFVLVAGGAGAVMFALTPALRRLMHGRA